MACHTALLSPGEPGDTFRGLHNPGPLAEAVPTSEARPLSILYEGHWGDRWGLKRTGAVGQSPGLFRGHRPQLSRWTCTQQYSGRETYICLIRAVFHLRFYFLFSKK